MVIIYLFKRIITSFQNNKNIRKKTNGWKNKPTSNTSGQTNARDNCIERLPSVAFIYSFSVVPILNTANSTQTDKLNTMQQQSIENPTSVGVVVL